MLEGISLDKSTQQHKKPRVVVIGVGGGGSNAVKHMIEQKLEGCEFAVCNTDAQALENSPCETTFLLGENITHGLGAGGNPEVGQKAAEDSINAVEDFVEGADMVFLSVGMGGGTGTGASPVIAEMIKSKKIVCIGVVSKPFVFENTHRMRVAQTGIEKLQQYLDALIVIPNENLISTVDPSATFIEALQVVDDVLLMGVRAIADLILKPGQINLDFNDIRTVVEKAGKAIIGIGEVSKKEYGEEAAVTAAKRAVSNSLLEYNNISEARAVLVNVTATESLSFMDMNKACSAVRESVHPDANIIFGMSLNTDEDFDDDTIRLSVLATGISNEAKATAQTQIGDKIIPTQENNTLDTEDAFDFVESVADSNLDFDDTDFSDGSSDTDTPTDLSENTGDTPPSISDSVPNVYNTLMQDTNTPRANKQNIGTDTPLENSKHDTTTSESQGESRESPPFSSPTIETSNTPTPDTVQESIENTLDFTNEDVFKTPQPEQPGLFGKIFKGRNKTKTENKQAPVKPTSHSTTKPTELPDFLKNQNN